MDIVSYILAKKYTDRQIAQLETSGGTLDYQVWNVLPETGQPDVIYLVPTGVDNKYSEYVWKDGAYKKLKDSLLADMISAGYLYAGVFWVDSAHCSRLPDRIQSIYVDKHTNQLYYYNTETQTYKSFLNIADSLTAGIMKLYSTTGSNEDGTMTQKVITDHLKQKVEIQTDLLGDECLGFTLNKA